MEDLIKALQIFAKYSNERNPTHCEHDILMVAGVGEDEMSTEDVAALHDLSFDWDEGYDCWTSYRFGSA